MKWLCALLLPQVKLLEGAMSSTHTSVAQFLHKAVEPPPDASVANAVRLLQDIGAFEAGGETLTVGAPATQTDCSCC